MPAPPHLVPPDRVAPVPRRIRAFVGEELVLDTLAALYGWEVDYYPQYYIPLGDLRPGVLKAEGSVESGPFGEVELHSLLSRPAAARVVRSPSVLEGTVRIEWDAVEWFEEDEQVFVHPRNPYARVDAIRSTRTVRVELEGLPLAESASPVMVFETGLPTRYYLDRTEVDFTHLEPSRTVTACPYKGTTSGYWSVRVGDTLHEDLAWSYQFPTRQLLPISGMIAFYNERVTISVS